jgi:hypothetical protein
VLWTIAAFPPCSHHVFLSHSAEDRATLVHPVHRLLLDRGVAAWLDRHDYPAGRDSRHALRDSLLRCRHAVFFITHAMLTQARGWCTLELAYAELIQDNLGGPGGPYLSVILPLFFVAQDDRRLPRTVWQARRDRGTVYPGRTSRVKWAVDQIVRFLTNEQHLAAEFAEYLRTSPSGPGQLRPGSGLLDRVTRFDPQPLPPPA